jgi:hypothetical protein
MSLFIQGCGLVFVPVVQNFPEPVKKIKVVDRQTGKDIPDATVEIDIYSTGNWIHLPPFFSIWAHIPTSKPAEENTETSTDDKSIASLSGHRDSEGYFIFQNRVMLGSMEWFFPLPSPLGWTLYRDHYAVLTVKTAEYGYAGLTYSPGFLFEKGTTCYPGMRNIEKNEKNSRCRLDENGVLWIYLGRLPQGDELNHRNLCLKR